MNSIRNKGLREKTKSTGETILNFNELSPYSPFSIRNKGNTKTLIPPLITYISVNTTKLKNYPLCILK